MQGRRQFEDLFAHFPLGVAIFDAAGYVYSANPRFCALLGRSLAETLDLHYATITHPDEIAFNRQMRESILDHTRESVSFEKRYRHADGQYLWVRVTLSRTASRPVRLLVVAEEIEERKQMELALAAAQEAALHEQQRSHALLAAIINLNIHAIASAAWPFATSQRENHLAFKRVLADLIMSATGCRYITFIGITLPDLQTDPELMVGADPAIEARWQAMMQGKRLDELGSAAEIATLFAGEVFIRHQPTLLARSEPIFGALRVIIAPLRFGETTMGLISLFFDPGTTRYDADRIDLIKTSARLATLILERHQLLMDRAGAQAREMALIETNRRLDAFLGMASHEIRTPLTVITGMFQILERRLAALGPKEPAFLPPSSVQLDELTTLTRHGLRQSWRLDRFVRDMLDASALQLDQFLMPRAPTDVIPIIEAAVEQYRRDVPQRQIDLLNPLSHPWIAVIDPDRIAQVIDHFLTNATKFSPPDRPIAVVVTHDAALNSLQISVTDHGAGLSPEEQDRIWERFYRVAADGQQQGSTIGLGLGLYLSRAIIERHEGAIGVTSTPGNGATFWFTLKGHLDPVSPPPVLY